MNENLSNTPFFTNEEIVGDDVPAWKLLDNVVRQWAVLSQHEKSMNDYETLASVYR
jgi:hypothetical protein